MPWSLRTSAARRRRRCSGRRSAPTSTAPSSASASARRSSRATRALRYTLRRVRRRGRARRPRGLLARGHRAGRARRDLGAELRRVGARPVRHRQARDHPRQRQPGVPDVRARVRAAPVGLPHARRRPAFKTSDYVGDGRGGPARGPRRSSRSCSSTAATGTSCSPPASASSPARAGRAPGGDAVRRPDQHPVHERHHGLPQGRDAHPPQHPQQRLLRRRGLPLHRGRTGSASRCPSTTASAWSWATSAARRTAPAWSSRRAAFEPGRGARDGAGGALHVALRRADDVHRRARAPALRRVRPLVAAHRDHGRLAVPDRDDAPRRRRRCTWRRSRSATA